MALCRLQDSPSLIRLRVTSESGGGLLLEQQHLNTGVQNLLH